jgi:hypothetical protein
MLSPVPATIWSTASRVAANASSAASSIPATMPASAPTNGFPVALLTATEVNAPAIKIPSSPMFTTPERSLRTPPSAA